MKRVIRSADNLEAVPPCDRLRSFTPSWGETKCRPSGFAPRWSETLPPVAHKLRSRPTHHAGNDDQCSDNHKNKHQRTH